MTIITQVKEEKIHDLGPSTHPRKKILGVENKDGPNTNINYYMTPKFHEPTPKQSEEVIGKITECLNFRKRKNDTAV